MLTSMKCFFQILPIQKETLFAQHLRRYKQKKNPKYYKYDAIPTFFCNIDRKKQVLFSYKLI